MSVTFGGATGHDITYNSAGTGGANGSVYFAAGWFLPTTLTAGRYYWSNAAIMGSRVDTTTSELEMLTDNVTTDGRWVTSGAGIVVNEWHFLAWFGSFNNTGPAADWRVWLGKALQAPQEISVSNVVAPVGNFASSVTFTVGNAGSSGTVSFQGQIEAFHRYVGTVGDKPFFVGTSGATTQEEADLIRQKIVDKIWSGSVGNRDVLARAGTGSGGIYDFVPMEDIQTLLTRSSNHTVSTRLTTSIAGITFSHARPPKPLINPNFVWTPPWVRR